MKKPIIRDRKYYFALIIFFVIVFIFCLLFFNRASVKRTFKSFSSEYHNGIEREIILYDYHGNKIKSWKGKFDVTQDETGLLFDDQDGKRVIITNGIIVNEEIGK